MTYKQIERWGRAVSADAAALIIEGYVDKAAADRYREEVKGWIATGISPYIWDNAMPLVREGEGAE